MIMQPVSSSNLQSVGYDANTSILRIRFHSGGIYDYLHVPKSVYDGLMSAPSKGTYHHRFIKNSYGFRKLG